MLIIDNGGYEMALEKLKGIFGGQESDDGINDEESMIESHSGSENTMILLEPRAYSESQQIADYLKENSSVVVNLKRVTPDQAKRIVDFLSGTIYAIGGDLQKLGGGIFLCTPKSINVEGKISDDAVPAKGKNNKKSEDQQEDDEFNW